MLILVFIITALLVSSALDRKYWRPQRAARQQLPRRNKVTVALLPIPPSVLRSEQPVNPSSYSSWR